MRSPRRATAAPDRSRWSTTALVAAVVLGAVLLTSAFVTVVTVNRQAAVADTDRALSSAAAAEAANLDEYFDRARTVELLLAADTALRGYEPGAAGSAPTVDVSTAGGALTHLEELYPGRISEACLIDTTGTELARVVRGRVAPSAELSSEEADQPFFAPTLALPAGRVYQSLPYVSDDTHEWVIANSTPMVSAGGTPWGLLHFEVTLASFRPATSLADHELTVVDTTSGQVVARSDAALPADGLEAADPALTALLRTAATAGDTVSATVGERRVAVARVGTPEDNANSWAVVASAPESSIGWAQTVAAGAVVGAAIVLLVAAAVVLRRSHRRLRQASYADALTGLPNRRLAGARLEQAVQQAVRRDGQSAVLLIDLDRFKEVNDTLGHEQGDRLLVAVAERLSTAFRASDTVARLGGDEFAVLLPEVTGPEAALELATRCLEVLHDPIPLGEVTLSVEASIGVAVAPQHGRDGTALLRAADVAMYEAKQSGRGVTVYTSDADRHSVGRLGLLGELRHALARDEFVLHYQPKVALDDDRVTGVEALVRWVHPQRGTVPPGEFLPVVESSGLILPLTLRTLEIAVAQARAWQDAGRPLQVAVNLSPRCLAEATLPGLVGDVLARYGLPPRLLRLELTETSIMADPDRSLAVLGSLRDLGVSISVDDFGTGYSSLSHLRRLPVDELKIDRSFVAELGTAALDAVLVRSAIDLSHNLGLTVVAEGVEDEPTLARLRELGCDAVQGYLFGRPVPADALCAWLTARASARPDGALIG